jgi:hypothetical protein
MGQTDTKVMKGIMAKVVVMWTGRWKVICHDLLRGWVGTICSTGSLKYRHLQPSTSKLDCAGGMT